MAALATTLALAVVAADYDVKIGLYVVTLLWAYNDWKRVELWRFDCWLAGPRENLFLVLLAFGWPVVFPWYLATRLKIAAGTAKLKEEFQPWRMSDQTVAPNGLLQPWRGKNIE